MALNPEQRDALGSILSGRLARLRASASEDDPGDPAFAAIDAACRHFVERDLQRTESALKRLLHGTIDTCSACRRPIPFEQLLAKPTRQHCDICVEAGALGETAPVADAPQ